MICKACAEAARTDQLHALCVDAVKALEDARFAAASGVRLDWAPTGSAGRWCDCQHMPVAR